MDSVKLAGWEAKLLPRHTGAGGEGEVSSEPSRDAVSSVFYTQSWVVSQDFCLNYVKPTFHSLSGFREQKLSSYDSHLCIHLFFLWIFIEHLLRARDLSKDQGHTASEQNWSKPPALWRSTKKRGHERTFLGEVICCILVKVWVIEVYVFVKTC